MVQDSGISKYIRADIATMAGYSRTPKPIPGVKIKLNANENLYGCSPKVLEAIARYRDFHLSPDPTQMELRQLCADYIGVGPEHVIAGNGSDELIYLITHTFVDPGDEVIQFIPGFPPYAIRTQMCGGIPVNVLRDDNFAIDIASVKSAITEKTKLVVIINPNNPTGTETPRQGIIEILETGIPVLVDEAYAEFGNSSIVDLVTQYENLMVLRTFSKWAALAGIRIGYGVFSLKIASTIMKIRSPFNVNSTALIAVRESMRDREYLMNNVKAIINERERLFTELQKMRMVQPVPSGSNFIFCRTYDVDAFDIQRKLLDRGISVKANEIPQGGGSLCMTIGRPEHTDAVITALREIEGELV
jgi:histidinol-phosphate aminotransferase